MTTQIDEQMLERSVGRFKSRVTAESLRRLCNDNEFLSEILEKLIDDALRYTESICKFEQIRLKYQGTFDENGERAEVEQVRGSIHDVFIQDVNILSRSMARAGKDITWRSKVGESRAHLGCFALLLSYEIVTDQKRRAS